MRSDEVELHEKGINREDYGDGIGTSKKSSDFTIEDDKVKIKIDKDKKKPCTECGDSYMPADMVKNENGDHFCEEQGEQKNQQLQDRGLLKTAQ